MANGRFSYPLFKAFKSDGSFANGYKLYSYTAGTTTAKATYQDAELTTEHSNPITLNALGEAEIYLDGATKFTLTDASGNIQTGWPVDDVDPTTVNASDVAYTVTGGSITSETVQAAIVEIETELLAKADASDVQASIYPNRIINPEMMIDQYNSGAATTTSSTYTVDRWQKSWSAGTLTVSARQSTGIGNSRNSNKFTAATAEAAWAAAEYVTPFTYHFLGYDVADLAGETVVVSFYFKSNFAGTYSVCLLAGDNSYSYVTDFSYETAAAEQLVQKTITIDATHSITNTTTGVGLKLTIAALAGTNSSTATTDAWTPQVTSAILCSTSADNWAATNANYVQISEVQLRKGAYMALGHKTRQEYLRDCMAYYQKFLVYNTGHANNTTSLRGVYHLSVPMIAAPTGSISAIANVRINNGGTTITPSSANTSLTNLTYIDVVFSGTGYTVGSGYIYYATAATYIILTAEI